MPDDLGNEDISRIANGAKAVTGKAVWSANGAVAAQREGESERKKAEEKHEAETREARELANLARWNGGKTTLGGVEMTNEEAQEARQRIIDNEDYYAERAVREGRIHEDEKDDYKFYNRRIRELEDKKGRGISSGDEDRECERMKRSRIGDALGRDIGEIHSQSRNKNLDARTEYADSNKVLKGDAASAVYGDAFQDEPRIKSHFAQAAAGVPNEQRDIPAPAPRVAATGLNI